MEEIEKIIPTPLSDSMRMVSLYFRRQTLGVQYVNEELCSAESYKEQLERMKAPDVETLKEFVYLFLIKRIGFLYVLRNYIQHVNSAE